MGDLDITVITPSIPIREAWLQEAMMSVARQTLLPRAHLISISQAPPGTPRMAHLVDTLNALAEASDTTWVSVLEDDNLLDPHHMATIAPYLDTPVDVVYTWAHDHIPDIDVNGWRGDDIVEALENGAIISNTVAIRKETLLVAGGWSTEGWDPDTHLYWDGPCWAEDWDLWLRFARMGARFLCVPEKTWTYRLDAPERISNEALALIDPPPQRVLHG